MMRVFPPEFPAPYLYSGQKYEANSLLDLGEQQTHYLLALCNNNWFCVCIFP